MGHGFALPNRLLDNMFNRKCRRVLACWLGMLLALAGVAGCGQREPPAQPSFYRSLAEPTLQAAMTTSYPAVKANLESQDYIEGPRAFAERRKPNWQNR